MEGVPDMALRGRVRDRDAAWLCRGAVAALWFREGESEARSGDWLLAEAGAVVSGVRLSVFEKRLDIRELGALTRSFDCVRSRPPRAGGPGLVGRIERSSRLAVLEAAVPLPLPLTGGKNRPDFREDALEEVVLEVSVVAEEKSVQSRRPDSDGGAVHAERTWPGRHVSGAGAWAEPDDANAGAAVKV
jgi:hypothetical protein